jgi:pilus assembly protein Flp/PilA
MSLNTLKRFIHDERGATAVEYGLITALISIAIMGSVNAMGGGLSNTFTTLSSDLANHSQ